jgi:hypothetical protein
VCRSTLRRRRPCNVVVFVGNERRTMVASVGSYNTVDKRQT